MVPNRATHHKWLIYFLQLAHDIKRYDTNLDEKALSDILNELEKTAYNSERREILRNNKRRTMNDRDEDLLDFFDSMK